jgi:antitoxin component YwqK of YwqJK toxin-antitoxin module
MNELVVKHKSKGKASAVILLVAILFGVLYAGLYLIFFRTITLSYPNSKIMYQGQQRLGKISGTGKYFYDDGALRYEGQWANGIAEGFGIEFSPAGRKVYEGEWKDGSRHGTGKTLYANGKIQYEGEFYNGYKKGQGTLYDTAGNVIYKGGWDLNKYNESGAEYEKDGILGYEGNWKYGLKDGNGAEYHPDGKTIKFQGKFHLNYYDDGIFFDAKGKEISAEGKRTLIHENHSFTMDELNYRYDPRALIEDITKSSAESEEVKSIIENSRVKEDRKQLAIKLIRMETPVKRADKAALTIEALNYIPLDVLKELEEQDYAIKLLQREIHKMPEYKDSEAEITGVIKPSNGEILVELSDPYAEHTMAHEVGHFIHLIVATDESNADKIKKVYDKEAKKLFADVIKGRWIYDLSYFKKTQYEYFAELYGSYIMSDWKENQNNPTNSKYIKSRSTESFKLMSEMITAYNKMSKKDVLNYYDWDIKDSEYYMESSVAGEPYTKLAEAKKEMQSRLDKMQTKIKVSGYVVK